MYYNYHDTDGQGAARGRQRCFWRIRVVVYRRREGGITGGMGGTVKRQYALY